MNVACGYLPVVRHAVAPPAVHVDIKLKVGIIRRKPPLLALIVVDHGQLQSVGAGLIHHHILANPAAPGGVPAPLIALVPAVTGPLWVAQIDPAEGVELLIEGIELGSQPCHLSLGVSKLFLQAGELLLKSIPLLQKRRQVDSDGAVSVHVKIKGNLHILGAPDQGGDIVIKEVLA